MNRKEILKTAESCVCGERERDYGTPEDNFGLIALLWSVYTGHSFTSKDVAIMMCLLKIARIKTGKSMDSFVDLAGYAACAGEIVANAIPSGAIFEVTKEELEQKRKYDERLSSQLDALIQHYGLYSVAVALGDKSKERKR